MQTPPPSRPSRPLFGLLLLAAACSSLVAQPWQNLNPGGGGAIQRVICDPNIPGRLYATVDMEGIYRSNDSGISWDYVWEGGNHGMNFDVLVEPGNSQRLYAGNLYGAAYSDNGGATWSFANLPIDVDDGPYDALADKGDSIGWLTMNPANKSEVFAAPGWMIKDGPKTSQSIVNPPQPLSGKRTLYRTANKGTSWTAETYDSALGYRQLYNMAFCPNPADGKLYLGAHSGVYKRNAANNYTRLPEPAGAASGLQSTSKTGGCRGIIFSPDGKWLYALWVTVTSGNDTRLFAYEMNQGTSGSWIAMNMGGVPGAEFAYPEMDPRSTAQEHRLMFAQINGREGLWESTIEFGSNAGTARDGFESGTFSGAQGFVSPNWAFAGSNAPLIRSDEAPYEGAFHARMVKTGELTQTIDLRNSTTPTLKFAYKAANFSDSDDAFVEVNDGSGWQTLLTVTTAQSDDTYRTASFNLSAFARVANFQIRFRNSCNGVSDKFYVDSVEVIGLQGYGTGPVTLLRDLWQEIGNQKANNPSQTGQFDYDAGWENRSWIVRSCKYSPVSWDSDVLTTQERTFGSETGPVQRRREIYVSSGMNLYRGRTDAYLAPAWVGGEGLGSGYAWPHKNAWVNIYSILVDDTQAHSTYATRGFQSTVNYDMAIHDQYALQSLADHAIFESFDGGISWTDEVGVVGAGRSDACLMVKKDGQPAVAIAHTTAGVGAVINNGGLYAKVLNNADQTDVWTLIGGTPPTTHSPQTIGTPGTNGLNTVRYQDFANHPSKPERVYVATQGMGIFVTENIYSLVDSNTGNDATFQSITTGTYLADASITRLLIDPNNANRLLICLADTGGFHIGTKSGGVWSFSQSFLPDTTGTASTVNMFNRITEINAWDLDGTTNLVAARRIGGSTGSQEAMWSFDGGANWVLAADTSDFLAINTPNWYQAGVNSFDVPSVTGVAGIGNTIYIGIGSIINRRHLAYLKGTIASDLSAIDWEDVSGAGSGRMYYARSSRARILQNPAGGEIALYVATSGVGLWKLPLTPTGGGSVNASDDFESGSFTGGTGWSGVWTLVGTPDIWTSNGPIQGSYHAQLRAVESIQRTVDLSGVSSATLTYSWKANSLEGSDIAYVEVFDGTWHTVQTIGADDDGGAAEIRTVDLSSYNKQADFRIRFRSNFSGNGDRFFVDEVRVD